MTIYYKNEDKDKDVHAVRDGVNKIMFYLRKQLGPLSSLQAVFRGLINLISSEINPEN